MPRCLSSSRIRTALAAVMPTSRSWNSPTFQVEAGRIAGVSGSDSPSRRMPGEAPWAFRILGAANDGWELTADDLAFLDDERVVVLRREDNRLQIALINRSGSAAPAWRVNLPHLTGAHVTVSPPTGAGAGFGGEP